MILQNALLQIYLPFKEYMKSFAVKKKLMQNCLLKFSKYCTFCKNIDIISSKCLISSGYDVEIAFVAVSLSDSDGTLT